MAFLIPICYMTALDNSGNIVSGARGYIYEGGTTNALQSYSDYELLNANATPYITADANGRFPLAYVADGELLRFLIKSADGATTYFDRDDILAPETGVVSSLLQSYSERNSNFSIDSSMNGKLIGVDTSGGAVAITANATNMGNGFFVTLQKITGDGNTITITPGGGETIDGQSTWELDTQWESITLISKGTGGWNIQSTTSREEYGEIDVVEVTSTTPTLAATDKGKFNRYNNAGAITLTVPSNASVPLPVGWRTEGAQWGAGEVTITPAGGVTIRSSGGKLKTLNQYSAFVLTKIAANEWHAAGELEV